MDDASYIQCAWSGVNVRNVATHVPRGDDENKWLVGLVGRLVGSVSGLEGVG